VQKPTIFLTGATGLVGSHILYELVLKKKFVKVLVRNANVAKKEIDTIFNWYSENSSHLLNFVTFIEGDLNDSVILMDCLNEIETVYHCAALVSTKKEDAWKMLKINGEGTANIVNCCLLSKVSLLLYVSSIATLDGIENILITEEFFNKEEAYISAYSLSKRVAEKEVWRGIEEGLKAVIINPSIIIGPSVKKSGIIYLIERVKRGLKFYTNGKSGYVYVKDVAFISISLVEKNIHSERFIINAENIEAKEIINKIAKKLGLTTSFKLVPKWMLNLLIVFSSIVYLFTHKSRFLNSTALKLSTQRKEYDNTKIKSLLGFNFTSIDKALSETIEILKIKN
jgi:nucleoside-diphosphate-sugar epimerase